MKLRIGCVVVGFLSSVLSIAAQISSPASAKVPPLVNFSGVLTDVDSKPLAVTVGVTFSLYKDQQGGVPLWLETQNVKPNSTGHYTVMLGSTTGQGIPTNIFALGEAHWLGVQVQGQAEQARVLLVSAPYALKAGDAETLGGKPASAFMVASANATSSNNVIANAVTGGGKKDYVPLWLSKTKLGSSELYQTGGNVGVRTTTPSYTLDVNGTGNFSGLVTFAPGQTFPGTARLGPIPSLAIRR